MLTFSIIVRAESPCMTLTLTSEKNPLLKDVRRATSRGELTEDGCVVAEGVHLLEEAIRSGLEIQAIIAAESRRERIESDDRILAVRVLWVDDQVFSRLTSTETPQGVIALVRPPVWTSADLLRGTPLIVILDAIQDPGNAGTIVRSAEAFGATGVVFLEDTVSPHNPKCLRASAGSLFRMPLSRDLFLVDAPRASFPTMTLYAAMPRAKLTLPQADLTCPCAIVVGNEGRGVSPNMALLSTEVRIPTVGVESLNAAVAAGVMLYEACRQRTRV
jgi:TrmH family RNA methyltransferase